MIVGLAALAGGIWGSRSRAENLLAPGSARPAGPPALWLLAWDRVPKQATAAAQYRHAQILTANADLEAAWLAVPGYFPENRAWASKAYIQLAREWFRRGDRDRLEALQRALQAAPSYADQALPRILQAAAALLRGDIEGMLNRYQEIAIDEQQNPALNELSLELVFRARRGVDKTNVADSRLRALEVKLTESLMVHALLRPDGISLGPHQVTSTNRR